jgi:HEAT repeat protein
MIRDISPHAHKLLAQAYARPHLLQVDRARPVAETLRALQESEGPALAPYLVPFLAHWDASVRRHALAQVRELVAAEDPTSLGLLEEATRRMSLPRSELTNAWRNLRAHGVDAFAEAGEARAYAFGLFSFHPNGHVREAAVRQLARSGVDALPFLLLRANDWVAPVRVRAYAALWDLAIPALAVYWERNWVSVMRLEGRGRDRHEALVERAQCLLAAPKLRGKVLASLSASQPRAGRSLFRVILRYEGRVLVGALARALEQRDAVVRLQAVRAAAQRLDDASLEKILARAAVDPLPAVRRAALHGAVERLPKQATAMLEEALLDVAPNIRRLARVQLPERDPRVWAQRYRAMLPEASGARLRAALAGLGETGTAADVAQVAPFARHPAARVRMEAIRTISMLDSLASVPLALEAMDSPSPKLCRAASEILLAHEGDYAVESVAKYLDARHAPHVRANAVRTLAGLSHWSAIGWLIYSWRRFPDLRELVEAHVCRWYRACERVFTRPADRQRQIVAAELARARSEGAAEVFARLEYIARL